jgi:hypothetical protein
MRNGLKMVALLTLLGSRSTIAQSKGSAGSAAVASANHIASSSHAPDATRLIGGAPVGYREPHAEDVPSENSSDLGHIGAADVAVDRKLIICRGC